LRPKGEFAVADRVGGEIRAVARPDQKRTVTVGAEVTFSDVTSDIFGAHTEADYAAYGEGEHHLGAARLTTGARIDFLAVDGGGLTAVVSPRVGAVLPAGRGVWRASLGRGLRAPWPAHAWQGSISPCQRRRSCRASPPPSPTRFFTRASWPTTRRQPARSPFAPATC